MAILYLSGHKSRGNDVRKVLESLGGKIPDGFGTRNFNDEEFYYYINDRGFINIEEKSNIEKVKKLGLRSDLFEESYTLENFEAWWPYKIGDKVMVKESCGGITGSLCGVIIKMRWTGHDVGYVLDVFPDKLISKDCLEIVDEDLIKDFSSEFHKGDCFISWDDHSEVLYLIKIKSINFKSGKATFSCIDVDATEDYGNKITIDGVKINDPITLKSYLEEFNKKYGWKKAESDEDFIKFISIKKELDNLVKLVRSSARKK